MLPLNCLTLPSGLRTGNAMEASGYKVLEKDPVNEFSLQTSMLGIKNMKTVSKHARSALW
jgi:hypothetical protein